MLRSPVLTAVCAATLTGLLLTTGCQSSPPQQYPAQSFAPQQQMQLQQQGAAAQMASPAQSPAAAQHPTAANHGGYEGYPATAPVQ